MIGLDGTVIFKMSGSGNDFVLLDGRNTPPDTLEPECIRSLCRRRTGVGGDGLVVIEPGSRVGAVRFHYFNADGSGAALCGNAALCAVRLAAWLQIVPRDGLILQTDSGEFAARCRDEMGEWAEIEVPAPTPLTDMQRIGLEPGEASAYFTTVGVPHLVVRVDDLSGPHLMERGRALRSHPAMGTAGANVNFVSQIGETWSMRTYERGVEAETLACGTGAVATAAALNLADSVQLPLPIRTLSGATLTVSADASPPGNLAQPRLAGEGRLVYRAILGGSQDCQ
jgi:diaminopimelate epimerase